MSKPSLIKMTQSERQRLVKKNDAELLRLIRKGGLSAISKGASILRSGMTSVEGRGEALVLAAGYNYEETRRLLLAAGVNRSARDAALLALIEKRVDHLPDAVKDVLKSGEVGIAARSKAIILAIHKDYQNTKRVLLDVGMTPEGRDDALLSILINHDKINDLPAAVRDVLASGETSIAARGKALQITAVEDYPNTRAVLLGYPVTQAARDKAMLTLIEREAKDLSASVRQILRSGPTSPEARVKAMALARRNDLPGTVQVLSRYAVEESLKTEKTGSTGSQPAEEPEDSAPAKKRAREKTAERPYVKRAVDEVLREHRRLSGAEGSSEATKRLVEILRAKNAKLVDVVAAIADGANVNAIVREDKTPLDCAPNDEIRHYLLTKGARDFKDRKRRLRELEAEYAELVGEPMLASRPKTQQGGADSRLRI